MEIAKLKKEQIELAKNIIIEDSFEKIERIAGCDQTFFDHKILSAVVVCDYNTMKILEESYAIIESWIPYVREYVFYREAPAIIEAFHKLKIKPDILLCDLNGILHPRRIGAASQLGLFLDQPTIGVSKNLLCGRVEDDQIFMENDIRGNKFISKIGAKPLYISPGYKISLKTSIEIVKNCMRPPHKLPEPLHLAHRYADKLRMEHIQ